MPGATIPDPLQPIEGWTRRIICIPDSPEWLGIITGLFIPFTKRYYWDEKTGDADAAADKAREIFYKYLNQACAMNEYPNYIFSQDGCKLNLEIQYPGEPEPLIVGTIFDATGCGGGGGGGGAPTIEAKVKKYPAEPPATGEETDVAHRLMMRVNGGDWFETEYLLPEFRYNFATSVKDSYGNTIGTLEYRLNATVDGIAYYDTFLVIRADVLGGGGGGGGGGSFPGFDEPETIDLVPSEPPQVLLTLDTETGLYHFVFKIPRAPTIDINSVSVVDPNQDPDVARTFDENGDILLGFALPRAPTIELLPTVVEPAGTDPDVVRSVTTVGDVAFEFHLPVPADGRDGRDGRDYALDDIPPLPHQTKQYSFLVPALGFTMPFALTEAMVLDFISAKGLWSNTDAAGTIEQDNLQHSFDYRGWIVDDVPFDGWLEALYRPTVDGSPTTPVEVHAWNDLPTEPFSFSNWVTLRQHRNSLIETFPSGWLYVTVAVTDTTPFPVIASANGHSTEYPEGEATCIQRTSDPTIWDIEFHNGGNQDAPVVIFFHREDVIETQPTGPGALVVSLTGATCADRTVITTSVLEFQPSGGMVTTDKDDFFDDTTNFPRDTKGFRFIVAEGQTLSMSISFA